MSEEHDSETYQIVDGAGRVLREFEIPTGLEAVVALNFPLQPLSDSEIPTKDEIDQEYRDAIEEGLSRLEKEIAAEECGVSWILDLRIGLIAFLGAFTLILLLLWLFR